MNTLIKKPLAWLPIAISAAALLLIVGYVAVFGVANGSSGDEGLAARIFQLLMMTEVLVVILFVTKWLPKEPKNTLRIFMLQIVAALIPFLAIGFLES